MVTFFFLIFMGTLSADDTAPPSCGALSTIAQQMEVELLGHSLNTCTGVTLEGEFNAEVLAESKCKSLGAIETELRQLELEQAVLDGFNKMKTDLNSFKREAGSPGETAAQEAGAQFVNTLKVAQSFEALLAALDQGGNPLLMALKTRMPQGGFPGLDVLQRTFAELCSAERSPDQCREGVFNPSEEALRDINSLLIAQAELTPQILEGWRTELAIKRQSNQEPWSFLAMRADLESSYEKLSQGEFSLTRAQLKAITDLDFISTSTGYLRNRLVDAQRVMGTQREMERFKFLLEDTQARQAAELQSKVSVLYQSFYTRGSFLAASEMETCSAAKLNFDKALQCMTSMEAKKNNFRGSDKARIEETLLALISSKNFHAKLGTSRNNCITNQALAQARNSGTLPASCEEHFGASAAALALRHSTLAKLRDKIIIEKQRLADFRTAAQQRLLQMGCFNSSIPTNIDCNERLPLPREALLLSNDTLAISLVLAKPPAEITTQDLSAYCQEPVGSSERALCAFGNGAGPSDIVEERPRAEEYQAPTDPGSRNIVGEAYKEALIGTITHVAQLLGNQYRQQMAPPNPYGRVNPYAGGGGPVTSISGAIQMGAAQQEMFYQRSQGRYMGF